ncbi:carboxypeptidase-like regulatory domain-containing protein [Sphingobacterium hungaricum]
MKQKLLSIFFAVYSSYRVSYAQNRQITGIVISSANGDRNSGVSVILMGTGTGTQTNSDGSFSISAPEGSTLIFRHVSHTEKSVLANSSFLNVTLDSRDAMLDEVVVVGYGSGVASKNAVGSFTQVSSEDIESRPNANALEALQGRVPGFQVFTSTGEPSATQSVRLNGVGSLTGSTTPLRS